MANIDGTPATDRTGEANNILEFLQIRAAGVASTYSELIN